MEGHAITRMLAAAVALGTLVVGCEPIGGMGGVAPAANPVGPSNVAVAPQAGEVSFGGSAEFGVTW